jgi:predicted negative regulator of RcsB-dependent stress response
MEKALVTDSVDSNVLWEHAGDICYALGDNVKALLYWEKALELQRKAEAIDEQLKRKIKKIKK